MNEVQIAAFVVALIVAIGMTIASHVSMKRQLAATLRQREPIPASQFGSCFYPGESRKSEIATFIATKIQELTGYDLTGMQPSDRFEKDLHISELDSLVSVEIIAEVEKEFGITISDEEAMKVETLADFVILVDRKTQPAPN